MKKHFFGMMAAILICGSAVFTSCSNDDDSSSSSEEKKGGANRQEFVAHTRQNLKEVAENLNFSTWNSVNYFNIYFNQYVLLSDDFDKTLSRTFGQEIQKSIAPLPAEVVEKTGKKYAAIVNLADFDYIFTATETGFDVTPNTEDGLVVDLTDPYRPEYAMQVSIVGSGEEYELLSERMSNDSVGVVVKIPQHYDFTFSTKQDGKWVAAMTVTTDLTVNRAEYDDPDLPAEAADYKKDAWNLKGTFKSSIPGDDVEMVFNIGQNPTTHKSGMTFDYTHNSKKVIGLTAELTNSNGLTDLSALISTNSIMDIMQAIMLGNSIDNMEITLLDDLTTKLKVTDCEKVLEIQDEMASARRSYADQATIDGYVSQLNKYISGSMTCKGVSQTIPMKLQTTKIGIDWWAAPALKFADEDSYVTLNDMLDRESVEYGLNIIDHSAEPMQQSIITVRQLMQALQKLQTAFFNSKEAK